MPENRWAAFTDAEFAAIWTGLHYDDGIRYGIVPEGHQFDDIECAMRRDTEAERQRRGLDEKAITRLVYG